MAAAQPYRYERLSKDNIHHLKELYRLVFKKNISVDFLKKKYNTEYIGKSFLGHIAFDNQRPVAYGGFVPFRIQYKDIIEIGAQAVDAMSLKEVRGHGLFKNILQLNEELLKSEEINFGYGFANQDSEPVFVHKFNWVSNQRMVAFMVPIRVFPSGKILNKLSVHKIQKKRIEEVLKPFLIKEPFINPFSIGDTGYTAYNEDFFRYKIYTENYLIKLDGIKVWLKADRTLSIGNIEDCTKEEFLMTILKLKMLGKKMGFDKMILQYAANSNQVSYLAEIYQPIRATGIILKPFSTSIPLEKILFANGDIDTF